MNSSKTNDTRTLSRPWPDLPLDANALSRSIARHERLLSSSIGRSYSSSARNPSLFSIAKSFSLPHRECPLLLFSPFYSYHFVVGPLLQEPQPLASQRGGRSWSTRSADHHVAISSLLPCGSLSYVGRDGWTAMVFRRRLCSRLCSLGLTCRDGRGSDTPRAVVVCLERGGRPWSSRSGHTVECHVTSHGCILGCELFSYM
mmetsp:Transcript_13567/g.25409  ORF Transcript_13567/g.25409 Transcript_13567/m.25409 type:complete len:201 (+) Transcript_13567:292-894(+)